MYYIIASHGEYAAACKKSCEMIIGEVPMFKVVTFTQEKTKEWVEEEYRRLISENSSDLCGAIITDIACGTPYNATAVIRSEYPEIPVVAGLSLPMLLTLGEGDAIQEAIDNAISAIKAEGLENSEKAAKLDLPQNIEPVEENGIVNFRLDERLIHGQVATYWTRVLNATRIMVVDDDILQDEIAKSALKAAVPSGLKLSILSTITASRKINEGAYTGQRVFLLVKKPETIKKLLDFDVKIPEVNIGNMGQREGRKQVKASVYCTDEERSILLDIDKAGIPVYAQMVPNDEKKKFASFLR